MRTAVNPQTIYPPFANYSHGVLAGGRTFFVSGQLGIAPDGSVPDGAYGQAVQCFANVSSILAEAGLQSRHVARINAFVSHRGALQHYMKARDEWIGELRDPPASTLMIVSGFARPEFEVEVEVTACC